MNKFIIVFLISVNSVFLYADILDATPKSKSKQEIIVDKDTPIEQKKFKPNFKYKYKNSDAFDYSISGTEETLWSRIKNKIISWLDDIFNTNISHNSRDLFNRVFNIAAIIILIAVIAYIIRAIIKKEALWIFKKSKKDFAIEYNDIEKDLTKVNFRTLISEAIEKDQKRLAIRYHYLLLLQLLSKNNIIEWDLEKTNSDYMSEIKDEKIKKTFGYLSYIYNNIWYGEFEVDQDSFDKAKKSFDEFINQWKNE